MELGDALRNLADVVDEIEESSAEVIEATPNEVDDGLVADLRVSIPADQEAEASAETAATAAVSGGQATGDGDAPVAYPGLPTVATGEEASTGSNPAEAAPNGDEGTTGMEAGTASTAESDTDEATPDTGESGGASETDPDDGTVGGSAGGSDIECTVEGCDTSFDSQHGMRIHRSKAHGPESADRDPDALAEAYDAHDSFEAMREALGADVSAQTVRRWMMDAGIHSPAGRSSGNEDEKPEDAETDDDPPDDEAAGPDTAESDGAGGEASDEPGDADEGNTGDDDPEATHDDLGSSERTPEIDRELPSGVTAEDLQRAVQSASTLYEVQQQLDLDREEARELLAEFDLLELVHGRVADRRRREELKDEIDDRLRANASAADSRSD